MFSYIRKLLHRYYNIDVTTWNMKIVYNLHISYLMSHCSKLYALFAMIHSRRFISKVPHSLFHLQYFIFQRPYFPSWIHQHQHFIFKVSVRMFLLRNSIPKLTPFSISTRHLPSHSYTSWNSIPTLSKNHLQSSLVNPTQSVNWCRKKRRKTTSALSLSPNQLAAESTISMNPRQWMRRDLSARASSKTRGERSFFVPAESYRNSERDKNVSPGLQDFAGRARAREPR